ncbi:unnamed protein product, partial [Meganyctiphanes norvegica]
MSKIVAELLLDIQYKKSATVLDPEGPRPQNGHIIYQGNWRKKKFKIKVIRKVFGKSGLKELSNQVILQINRKQCLAPTAMVVFNTIKRTYRLYFSILNTKKSFLTVNRKKEKKQYLQMRIKLNLHLTLGGDTGCQKLGHSKSCDQGTQMEAITDVTLEPLPKSQFVKPQRMQFKQNGRSRIWDLVSLHESVSIIIFNTTRQKLILVQQFRPAVYYSNVAEADRKESSVDTNKYPAKLGITTELCAGIVDKTTDLAQTAKEEVLEECGYDVPIENFEKVLTYRSGVGVSGDRQTLFYCEVTDTMKKTEGGGLESEGEMIDVVEKSVEETRAFLKQSEVIAPGGLLFALMWFMQNKAPKD